MITGLDHIAIAVPELEQAITQLVNDFGLSFEGRCKVDEQLTETAFFKPDSPRIELVAAIDEQGPIHRFLQKRKGLHHIAFKTDDIEADVTMLKAKGYEFLSEQPTQGAHGSRVIFIHPRSCFGVLVELTEPARA